MRSPQSTATMRGRSGFVHGRFVGAAAIAFAVLYVTENVLFAATGAAPYGAPIEDVLPRLNRFVEDTVIVGHNIAFDMRFFAAARPR